MRKKRVGAAKRKPQSMLTTALTNRTKFRRLCLAQDLGSIAFIPSGIEGDVTCYENMETMGR